MRYTFNLIALVLIISILPACEKESSTNTDCFSNNLTVRQITNAPATVRNIGGRFYIIEQNTIDTKLNPCTLAQEFQVDNLQVTVSGDVKSTIQNGPEPCCTENFVITRISR
jgi:hypothetical protein